MTVEMKGDEEIRRFVVAFNDLGVDVTNIAMAGDLSDLLWTLEKTVDRLRSLRDGEFAQSESPAALMYQLEMTIVDEIPPIIRDLVPSLRRVRNALYRSAPSRRQIS